MLRTIILQSYKKIERRKVVNALDELCSPNDNYGWASAGIYVYWNYYTNEVLYIGLTVDLTERFKQHNGFYPSVDRNTCKYEQIEEYFKDNEKLGFSIIVQSSLSQPVTSKLKKEYKEFTKQFSPIESYIGNEGLESIKHQEGVLIEVFKRKNGNIPQWNKMNGSISGQDSVKPINYDAIKVISNRKDNILLSKSSLFELAESSTFERYENFLHAVRILAPVCGEKRAIEILRNDSIIDTYREMIENGYINKKLEI
ncbi:conserved protein of unknown function [Tenacibaculum sp. 190130A14a]|uniref:GIY-YIG domain-containing protein n=1 Tax=Tenacibaculum polynesiense TaxID=3137857 RepID=A0ABP1ESX9_9FLAO